MNEQEALKNFVAGNVDLLTSENLDRHGLKNAIHQFYIVQQKKRLNTPTNFEVMEQLVARLQTSMSDQQLQALIDRLPLFRLTGEVQRGRLKEAVARKEIKSVLTEEQLGGVFRLGTKRPVIRPFRKDRGGDSFRGASPYRPCDLR
jgi:hypothetical protein